MDTADVARRSTVLREGGRAVTRSELLREALADPDLAPALTAVDRRGPDLADSERVRVAKILSRYPASVRLSIVNTATTTSPRGPE
jgi:hypothetical protein